MNDPSNDEFDLGPDIGKCIMANAETDQIRFTKTGLEYYGSRFARAGIDIRQIKRISEFRQALRQSFHVVMEDSAKLFRSRGNQQSLERKLLIALTLSDHAEVERLQALLDRRNRAGLTVVSR